MKLNSNAVKTAAVGAFVAASTSAFALGGLDKAASTATEIKTGLYTLVGIAALIYMIYLGIMAMTEKKSWSDFGWGVVHVAAVGGAVALATWAWSLFA